MKTKSHPSSKILPNILLLSCLFPATPAVAGTHLRDGAFQETWEDLTIAVGKSNWGLTRSYSSRSLYRGIFGFGWCSNIELKVIQEDQKLQIQNCDSLMTEQPRTIQIIMNTYVARFTDYTLVFDLDTNRLREIQLSTGSIILKYDHRNRPNMFCTKSECTMIHYAPRTDLIQKLVQNSKNPILYNYNDDDLVFVSVENKSIQYKYDYFHNLISIQSPNQTELKMSYDDREDLIIGLQKGDLSETYEYSIQSNRGQTSQTTLVRQYFRNKIVFSKKYNFP